MKKLFSIAILFVAIIFSACSKSSNTTTGPTPAGNSPLTVSLSRNTVENNGWDLVRITVKDSLNNDVTSQSVIYLNNSGSATSLSSSIFYPSNAGSFTISAALGSKVSNNAPLTVLPPTSPSAFTHKILVEDYTSIYCGYCPREAYDLDTYTKTHSNCAWVGVHCTGLGPDAYAFQYCNNLESSFGISGYPTTIVNRKLTWQEDNATLNGEAGKWTCLGLAVNSSVSGNTISGTAQVKFNVTTTKPMKIIVALVESGLLASQHNYYSPSGGATPYLYNGQNPIPNFEEKYCFRATSTNLFGDTIPVAQTFSNNVYSVPFTFSTSGVNGNGAAYTVNPANCRIVAYVVDGSTTPWSSSKGVINVQYAAVGATQNFD
jgi:Outer membrane protein Omp28